MIEIDQKVKENGNLTIFLVPSEDRTRRNLPQIFLNYDRFSDSELSQNLHLLKELP